MSTYGLSADTSLTPDTRESLQAIFELAPIGIGIVDLDGHTIMSNERLRTMLGYSREEFARLRFEEYTHPDDIAINLELFSQMAQGETDSFEMEKRFFRHDGTVLWGHLTSSLVRDAEGRPEYAIGMLQDITDRKLLAEDLQSVQERYRLLVERVPAVVYIAEPGASGRWVYVSPQSKVMLGFSAEEWMNDPDLWLRQIHPDDREEVLSDELYAQAAPPGEVASNHYRMLRADGRVIWVRDDALVVRDEEGGVLYHGMLVDVTPEKTLEARLEHQAFHDPLTLLPNRKLFRDRVEHSLKQLERHPENRAAVLFIDLDNFKAVNDGFGHACGDEILVSVAERIGTCLRGGDTAARLGGDEFGLLIEDLSEESDAIVLAERVLDAVRRVPFNLRNRAVALGASIGIAIGGPGDTAEMLLRNADLAMYRAKDDSKGGFAVYESSMHETAVSRLRLEGALRSAVERCQDDEGPGRDHGLSVAFQPIVNLETGEVDGFEALARWSHPELGHVSPLEFIPMAEEARLVYDLGRWVLERACSELAAWRVARGRDADMSVNVSPLQLEDDRFPGLVAATLAGTGINPSRLILEVTEGVLLVERCRDALEDLRGMGVRIAVDDFGTGYSSLSYLRRFPIDILKIDRSFVNHIQGEMEDRAFLQAIIKLAESLSLKTIAEGIETYEQLDTLRALGCRLGQGFLIARPSALSSIPEKIFLR